MSHVMGVILELSVFIMNEIQDIYSEISYKHLLITD